MRALVDDIDQVIERTIESRGLSYVESLGGPVIIASLLRLARAQAHRRGVTLSGSVAMDGKLAPRVRELLEPLEHRAAEPSGPEPKTPRRAGRFFGLFN